MREQWEHRVELFGMEWRRQQRLPDAEGLQRKLNEWGAQGWQLVAFEMVRDEYSAVERSEGGADIAPTAAYLAILKRLRDQ
ncbi:MAG: hypothetical protein ACRD0K_26425 [Egibacteraceae bacterium]